MQLIIVIIATLYTICLSFLLLYSSAQAYLLIKYILSKKKSAKNTEEHVPEIWPAVTVQLPVYNEIYVIERLIDAVMNLDYPPERLEIQVLDDSDDETTALITKKISEYNHSPVPLRHIRRPQRTGFKAGALKYGLEKATGEFFAIFDADFLPPPNFLKQTIPSLLNPEVGMVQTRWAHINRSHSLLTELQAFALDAHFRVEQVGRNASDCFINFNGTGGVWRKACILDAGNWEADTLTEDLDLSYRAQLKGWKFKYLENVEASAELPPVMSALKSQQYRWTKGGAETARKHLKAVFKSKLSLLAKWQAVAHLLNSAIFVNVFLCAVLSVPVLFLKDRLTGDGFFTVAGNVYVASFFIISMSYLVTCLYNRKSKWRGFIYFLLTFPLFISMAIGLSLHHAIAVLEGYFGKKTPFIRTPKFNVTSSKIFNRQNIYLGEKLSPLILLEGGIAIFFLVIFSFSYRMHDYGMMIFHFLVATGFFMVFFESIRGGTFLKANSQK